MKKILFVLVALMVITSVAYAAAAGGSPGRFNQDQTIEAYVSENTSNTAYATENVATTTIVPGYHRILGFSIAPLCAAGETAQTDVSLCDDDDDVATDMTAVVFAEAEMAANMATDVIWFAYPKKLNHGLTIRHGPNSCVVVYYEYYRQ